jgi:hypothetical protein
MASGSDESVCEDVVVCGGGIVGVAIAYFLSRTHRVCPLVIERCHVACAASGKVTLPQQDMIDCLLTSFIQAGGFLGRHWGSGPTSPLHTLGYDLHRYALSCFVISEALASREGIVSWRRSLG